MTARTFCITLTALACLALFPGLTSAQSGIAGIVRDTSGAVLPGVTVEAASPALIEKVRSAVTDDSGSYRILDLRPGQYTVTFALAGFSTVRREGIELPPAFTATVNADLAVGAIEETITVSGAAPLVDVQNTGSQSLLSAQLLEAIPATRSVQGFAGLTPGITSQGIGLIPGSVSEMGMSIHGSTANEASYTIDGMNVGSAQGVGGGSTFFRISQSYVAEMNIVTGGGMAEQPYSGVVTNIIPKEGGNTFGGSVFAEYTGSTLAASNLTDSLRAFGFTDNSLSTLVRLWDFNPAFGGRILRDRLWFFASYRNSGTVQSRAGVFENLTPLGWAYTPDVTQPAVAKVTQPSKNLRLTWQATPRNKISLFGDAAPQAAWNRGYQTASGFLSPEATTYSPYIPDAVVSASWKSPVTSQWLLDASAAWDNVNLNMRRQTPDTCSCTAPAVGFDVISAVEATTATSWRSNSDLGPGNRSYGEYPNYSFKYASNVSYITGEHAAKAGVQFRHGAERFTWEANGAQAYLLRNGIGNSIRQYANPIEYENVIHADLGLFVQNQWTRKRLTLTGGIRYDYLHLGAAPKHLAAGLWVPARDFPAVDHTLWKDVSPRIGASFDVFGDGRTAIKATLGRYVIGQGATDGGINLSNPVRLSVLSVNRTWNDANRNFNPDCDLASRFANGECGQISDLNFGQNNPNATTYDKELVVGLRNYNWESSLVLQRQLAPGVSVTAGYYRRSFNNFTANDNLLVTPADFSHYCVTAPGDPRLPGGGGQQICGLYDVSPALFGRNQTVVRDAAHYGTQSQIYDGFDLTENIRLPGGATISGGLNMGRTKTSACFTVDSPGALLFCEVNPPFQPNMTFTGFTPLPAGFVASATYRDYPGTQLTATRQTTNAEVAPSLGRNLSNGVNGTVQVPLIEPGTMFGPRLRQLDLRLSKRLRLGARRFIGNIDVFNLLNATGINTWNLNYGPNWQQPALLQQGRYVKLSGQFDF
jgi:hypothetical protein